MAGLASSLRQAPVDFEAGEVQLAAERQSQTAFWLKPVNRFDHTMPGVVSAPVTKFLSVCCAPGNCGRWAGQLTDGSRSSGHCCCDWSSGEGLAPLRGHRWRDLRSGFTNRDRAHGIKRRSGLSRGKLMKLDSRMDRFDEIESLGERARLNYLKYHGAVETQPSIGSRHFLQRLLALVDTGRSRGRTRN